ncbi:MAG: hypothetical protein R3Y63_12735 [Eubacteriales bacterium]
MNINFLIEGLADQGTATSIIDKIKKIVGVQDATLDVKTGELSLTLERPNGIIFKLVEHVVQKQDGSLVLKQATS